MNSFLFISFQSASLYIVEVNIVCEQRLCCNSVGGGGLRLIQVIKAEVDKVPHSQRKGSNIDKGD